MWPLILILSIAGSCIFLGAVVYAGVMSDLD